MECGWLRLAGGTAICMVDQEGALLAEAKVPTCPDANAD